jgi:hypothetical protein
VVYALVGAITGWRTWLPIRTARCRRVQVRAWWGGTIRVAAALGVAVSLYSAIITFQNRRKFRDMMPWNVAILMCVQVFFTCRLRS